MMMTADERGPPALSPVPAPILATVARPARKLGPIAFLRTATTNTLGICDEEVFRELVVVRRYGPFPVAFVSDPEGVRRILVERPDDYPRLATIRRLYATDVGTGTLASDGQTWRDRRRIAAAVVDRRAFLPDLPRLLQMAEAEAETWGEQHGAAPFNLERAVADLWFTVLNEEVTGGDPRGRAILAWLAKVPRKPRFFDVLPMPEGLRPLLSKARLAPARAALREELTAMIRERESPGWAGPRDLLWRVAQATDRTTGRPLPLEDRRDEASSILAAGEATIRGLTWFWYLLAQHPGVRTRVEAELDGLEQVTPEALERLPYLKRVVDEALRLYPPIPTMVRQGRQADVIGGKRIPKGAYVFVIPWVIHRHERLWDDPERFDPDRFLPERRASRPRLAYIPFSAGARVCSGASLATAMMLAVIAALGRRYRIGLAPGRVVDLFGAITLHPRGGLWATLERR